jgi:hypothetical protein
MRRVLVVAAVAAAFAVPASVVVGSGSAGAPILFSITCTKLSGTFATTITIKKCSVPPGDAKTYKSAAAPAGVLAPSGGDFTWSTSGTTTTISSVSESSPGGHGACNKYSTEDDYSGMVTGGTSAVTHAGDLFAAQICLNNKTNKLSLVKGNPVLGL